MPCYKPLKGWKGPDGGIVFGEWQPYHPEPMQVPCGRCIGCRLERSQQWAARCMHEASMHDHNAFITLTYKPTKLPMYGSLVPEHWTKFMKDLRYHSGQKLKFYMCGEYGEELSRPHYHACMFGLEIPDKKLHSNKRGIPLYRSEWLQKIWSRGFVTIGQVNWKTAAYTARYVMKKITGEDADEHYSRHCAITDRIVSVEPEFTRMSRKPGIGKGWFDVYGSEVKNHDSVIVDSYQKKPPRFYDNIIKEEDPERYEEIKAQRIARALENWEDSTPRRLKDRETCKEAQVSLLKRNYEVE